MKTLKFKFKTSAEQAITNFNLEGTRFLSNSYPEKIVIEHEGVIFFNVETAYQAAKITGNDRRRKIAQMSPQEAKKAIASPSVPDWENIKFKVMFNLLWQKFYGNKDLAKSLLATGNKEIVKLNADGDIYWGVCKSDDEYVGENNIGHILMAIREKLRALPEFAV